MGDLISHFVLVSGEQENTAQPSRLPGNKNNTSECTKRPVLLQFQWV